MRAGLVALSAPKVSRWAVETTRLPVGPLEDVARRILSVDNQTNEAVAALLGVWPRQIYRWRHAGLTWEQADELAVRLGLHPSAVWGRLWWLMSSDEDADDLTN